MILDPKHFFLTSSGEIDNIIQPLKDYFGVTSFIYQRNCDSGHEIRLGNQPVWIDFFYRQELYKHSVFERKPSQYVKNKILWDCIAAEHSEVLSKAGEFNIAHGITFIEPFEGGCEFFFIGLPKDKPDLMNKYLMHLNLLEKFIIYFRERAAPLINEARQHKILIPNKFEMAPESSIGTGCSFDPTGFLENIQLETHSKLLSIRELQCGKLLLHGYTIKMIGQELKLSPRTIETYVSNLKQKLHAFTKAELIKALDQYFRFF